MTWSWRLVAVAAMTALLPACSGDAAAGAGGGGTGGETPGFSVAVTFDEPGPLVLAPGQIAELSIRTEPPGEHGVSFLLLGDSFDASIDRDAAVTDASGRATVALQAPSKASSFRVRAVVPDGQPAEVEVRVTELGDGSVRVVPRYEGDRATGSWTAVVVPRARCADVSPYAPAEPDGSLIVTADEIEDLLVEDVPVGPRLAVIVRSEQQVGGCAEAVLTRADAEVVVEVAVLDRPIQLGDADLAVELGLDPGAASLAPLLDRATDRIADATFPEDASPASVLLDALADQLDDDAAAALHTAREEGLDDAVAADLTSRSVEPRSALLAIVGEGAARPLGATTARLLSASAGAAHALFAVDQVLGVAAARAGAPVDHLVSFGATAGDVVLIGGAVFFFPTRLLGALADDARRAAEPGTTAADTLRAEIDCAAVSAAIGAVDACDVACVEVACGDAVAALWSRGIDASAAASDLGTLSFAVSGTGEVDDQAALVGFAGTWVGAASAGVEEIALSGPATAVATGDADPDGPEREEPGPAPAAGPRGAAPARPDDGRDAPGRPE